MTTPAGTSPANRSDVDSLLAPLPQSSAHRFLAGFLCAPRALTFLVTHPRLLVHIIAPSLITLAVLCVALWTSIKLAPVVVGALWSRPPHGWQVFFWYVAAGLAGMLLVMLALVLTYALAGMISTPFNDVLAERVVEIVWRPPQESVSFRFMLSCALTSLRHSFLNLCLYLLIMIPLLLLNLIPVAGSILFAATSAVTTVFFLARDLLDGPLSLKRLSYRQKIGLVKKERALCSGLGAAAALLMWVPVLNLLLLPVAAVAASLLYCRMEANGLVPEPRLPIDRRGEADTM
ncbi:MAG: EI24 domain-containing protein [Acidobacteriota bacterium]